MALECSAAALNSYLHGNGPRLSAPRVKRPFAPQASLYLCIAPLIVAGFAFAKLAISSEFADAQSHAFTPPDKALDFTVSASIASVAGHSLPFPSPPAFTLDFTSSRHCVSEEFALSQVVNVNSQQGAGLQSVNVESTLKGIELQTLLAALTPVPQPCARISGRNESALLSGE